MIQYVQTKFAYDEAEILRRLKIQEDTPAWIRATRNFSKLVELARENMEITACYSIRDNDLSLGAGDSVKEGCEKMVVAFATGSRRIGQTILRLMDEGHFMDSYVLNDLVNDVLFKCSEQMNLQIEARMRQEGLSLTESIFPGEKGVDLRYMETLMNTLKKEGEIPATLSSNYMISPEKSVLYAYGAGRGFAGVPVKHDCANCSFTTCFYRSSGRGGDAFQ